MELSILGWCFISIIGLTFANLAAAYPTPVDFSGKLSRWSIGESNPVVFYRVEGDDQYDEAYFGSIVDDAALIWSQVETSFISIDQAVSGEGEQILVKLRSSLEEAPLSAGFSTFDEYDSDDKPVHCTIEILSTMSYLAFAKTILHELGHCIGLGHSLIPESIMSYSLSATRFELDTDDTAAVSRLYPVGGDSPALPPGCAISGSKDAAAGYFLLFPILLVGFLRKKRLGPFKWSQLQFKQ